MSATRNAALFGIAFALSACGTVVTPPSSTPTPTRVPPSSLTDATPVSAKEYADEALAEAQKIAPDAILVTVATARGQDFDAHVPSDGKAPEWIYMYYSPSTQKEVHVGASSKKVEMRFTFDNAITPVMTPTEQWIDSTEAFAAAQAAGGAEYQKTHMNHPTFMALAYDATLERVVWDLRYNYFVREGVYGYFVEANEAKVISGGPRTGTETPDAAASETPAAE